jgi:exodeoxyribonuclease-1
MFLWETEVYMRETLYWHDYETTGTDPARDRPIQFAGVRTDMELNVLEETPVLYCRLSNDVLPDPAAVLVTGITPSELDEKGQSENHFIGQINSHFSQPGTCVLGYNSLRFDDEFTRYTLYRNLRDPYAREWQGGNSRWDIIDLVRMTYALRPQGINWPEKEQGVPSFRLEDLTAANNIQHTGAHDALADVRATIALARLIKQHQPRLFDYLFHLRKKPSVLKQLYPLGKSPLVHVSSMYPAQRGCLAVVVPLASHPTNNNAVIVYDLAVDPQPLLELDAEAIRRRVFTPQLQLEEGVDRIPLKTIHINRCPAIAPLKTLTASNCGRLKINLAECDKHLKALQSSAGLVEKIQDAVGLVQFDDALDPDLLLYGGGFFPDQDRQAMDQIINASEHDLVKLSPHFIDPRLDEMFFRYKARNYPGLLDAQEVSRWNAYRKELWSGTVGVDNYLLKLDLLMRESTDMREQQLLQELRQWALTVLSSMQ